LRKPIIKPWEALALAWCLQSLNNRKTDLVCPVNKQLCVKKEIDVLKEKICNFLKKKNLSCNAKKEFANKLFNTSLESSL
jgi:hypothetical protein